MARRRPKLAKVDANQTIIVEALRLVGFSVQSLAKVADGCPDIVVGWGGENFLFEIKSERNQKGEPYSLTTEEKRWHQEWKGQVAVVTSAKDVVWSLMVRPKPTPELTPAQKALALL